MASTYLSKTITNDSSNTKATISVWCKRTKSSSGTEHHLYAIQAGVDEVRLGFDGNDCMFFYYYPAGTGYNRTTNRKFRDFNAWYHIVVQFDSTQSTADDRIKIYINGIQETSFSLINNPGSSANSYLFQGTTGYIGCSENVAGFFDGVLSHYHISQGYAYDASTFGETDATTGIWKPKTAPSVTYGTNGFFLKFENSGSMGTDSSPNGNNFTVNGTLTQTVDTPSNVFATLNPLYYETNLSTLSSGNLKASSSGAVWKNIYSNMAVGSGKWYCEIKIDSWNGSNTLVTGVISVDSDRLSKTASGDFFASATTGIAYNAANGNKVVANAESSYGNSYTSGDILGIAMDLDNNKLYFSKNGTWQNSGDPTSGATGTGAISLTADIDYVVAIAHYNTQVASFNFGNGYFGTTAVSSATSDESGLGIFEYTVPSGYYALCTKNINEQEYN